MFQQPSNKTLYVAPAEAIDIDQRYLFKLVKLEDEGISKFADQTKGEDFHNIRWHFRVAFADGKSAILTPDGEPWEHVEWTSSKTGKNPANGMVAKARLWIEALLGHTLEDEEITPDLPQQLLQRVASGFFEEKEITSQIGETYTRLKILRLTPYKAGAKAEPKPAPTPAPAPKRQPVAVAAGSTDDLEDLPF